MKISEKDVLLRIFVNETDKYNGKALYEQIVIEAKRLNIAGATVIRGIMGYGATSHMHSAKLLRLAEDLPVIIELIDKQENLNKLMFFLEENVKEGLVVMQEVKVYKYRQE